MIDLLQAVHLSSHISPEMLDPGGAMPVIEVAPQHNLDLEAAEENESILANSKGIHGHIEDTDSPTDPIDCLRYLASFFGGLPKTEFSCEARLN